MNGVDFSYVGSPIIGSIVSLGKAPTMLDLAGLVGDCQVCGGFDRVKAMVFLTGLGLLRHQQGKSVSKY